ncbi:MAG TPA: hypothetical protein VHW74_04795 [Mycobacteriales bacterium]|jgi:hypothetical protein|nr:hypothetical protein [Mycobacteriales bacterium]
MNSDDILRSGLHDLADEVSEIADLHRLAVQRGRRRRSVRRATAAGSAVLSVAAVAGVGVVVAENTGGGSSAVITPLASEPSDAQPWWQAWATGRHDGPVDQTFLDAANQSYEATAGGGPINAYATGTTPDGTDWVMFTDSTDGNVVQWLQGWNGAPDFGASLPDVVPGMTWSSFATPTLEGHNMSGGDVPHWLVIVGRPGTSAIDYSPDGSVWTPLQLQDGIGVIKISNGFPPATAQVRLSDATGVYATGTPDGSGAAQPDADGTKLTTSPTPVLSTPLATPTATRTTP